MQRRSIFIIPYDKKLGCKSRSATHTPAREKRAKQQPQRRASSKIGLFVLARRRVARRALQARARPAGAQISCGMAVSDSGAAALWVMGQRAVGDYVFTGKSAGTLLAESNGTHRLTAKEPPERLQQHGRASRV